MHTHNISTKVKRVRKENSGGEREYKRREEMERGNGEEIRDSKTI